ncbi:beta-ketoacyl-[acyl-carrier-protein] synthase III A, chloroplastic [Magnolia sinica]|uniref:beta-ketoacyl-[acyl-carrier-protein] synthase III A, chloroplastic n=1 Tax=Magnolia sinica TaxID=86752 RepID=UPI00265AF235|nr:beta-ketoacyl-[acyl-carrier-protein] synthase III A, chloroplastic [Magnolia sinica]
MANASGLISPSVPCIRRRNPSSFGNSRSGFCAVEKITKRVFRLSAIQGAEELALGASPSKARAPGLVGKGCKLVGCGSALPKLLISNDDLAQIVETSDEWISVRTGIRNRRILSGDETLTGLAIEASRKALNMAQVEPDDVDLILMCTSTPDDLFGSGPQVQKELGCKRNPLSFDIRAACSGFLLGLTTAGFYIRAGGFRNVLVIGADALSRYVDWKDRGTCILFGDAAGAVLVQACDGDEDSLLGFDVHSDGDGQRHLNAIIKDDQSENVLSSNGAPVFPPRLSSYSCIHMNGKEVFRFAVRCVPQSIETSLERAGLVSSNIDWLLLHQANQRIIDAVATRLQIPPDHVISNLANYGNTSAASIPLALDEAVRSGKVQAGNIVAAAGFGAGLTWGSAILKWG